ncbi:MAG TPA: alpha/beta hydrolase [Candidatus Limnocylindrales bacterium]|nr:alpha/beta hydrolase [Candidatus Limnocylindrales bacterium]
MTTTWTDESLGNGTYADLNGLHLYYEVHGSGRPLVVLHGGLGSGEMFGPILPQLADHHQAILVDLQGHGRTADIDRPFSIEAMADDVAALIEHLGLERPDVMGYSLGGGVAILLASRHPDLVRRIVVVSANARPDAIDPALLAQQNQLDAAAAELMQDTPMYELYQRVAPRPEDFGRLLDKIGAFMAKPFDYSDVVRGLRVPTLIACGDADMAPPSYYAGEMFALLDGGLRDGGWMGENRPKGGHALAVIPNATHYNVFASPVLGAAALDFLDAPS